VNSVRRADDETFANDFYEFLTRHIKKNVKSRIFLKSEENVNYVLSNTGSASSRSSLLVDGTVDDKLSVDERRPCRRYAAAAFSTMLLMQLLGTSLVSGGRGLSPIKRFIVDHIFSKTPSVITGARPVKF